MDKTDIICFKKESSVQMYDRNSKLQYQWAKNFIKKYNSQIAKTILDIGCGNGRVTSTILAKKWPDAKITGIDLNNAMIIFAKKKYGHVQNINFEVANIEVFRTDVKYDLIFSCCCLQWLGDQTLALLNIKKMLATNGNILIILPAKTSNSIFPIGHNLAQSPKWSKHFAELRCVRSYYTESEYICLLKKVGLTPQIISTITTQTCFQTIDELRNWIKPICTYYEYLSTDVRELFLDDLIVDIMSNYINVNDTGKIIVLSDKLEVYATN